LPGLTNAQSETISSPWGKPSAALRTGEIAGLPIVFLSRHDKGHRLSPTDINYRANIDVLKRAGVTDLVSLSANGSFREDLPPGIFVLVDQFLTDGSGATAVEYSLIAGGIVLAIIASVCSIGPKLNTTFSSVSSQLK
jgi:purine nucleoside phosphorylase